MKISLIIPTLKRDKELWRLLKSLSIQTYKNFEVIVVDLNGDEILSNINYENEFGFKVSVVCPPKKISASASRNFGEQFSNGELITFPDDDSWYSENILGDVVSLFANNMDIDIISGRSVDPEVDKSDSKFLNKNGFVTNLTVPKSGIEYSIFFKKNVFKVLGGFDEKISPGSAGIFQAGEAMDILYRAVNKQFKIFYSKEIAIFHPSLIYNAPHDFKGNVEKQFFYAAGFGYVLNKNKKPLIFLYYLLRSLGALIIAILKINGVESRKQWLALKGRYVGYFKQ